jgi:UDP-glucose 4-epimerase
MDLSQIKKNLNGQTTEVEYEEFKTLVKNDEKIAKKVNYYLNTKKEVINLIEVQENHKTKMKKVISAAAAVLLFSSCSVLYSINSTHALNPGVPMGVKKINKTIVKKDKVVPFK